MTKQLYGTKLGNQQTFTDNERLVVTKILLTSMSVTQQKTAELDGYNAIQIGFGGYKRHPSNAQRNHIKNANNVPKYLREIPLPDLGNEIKVGDTIKPEELLKLGDIVKIQGTTKGKGFTGVIKRWGFSRQPKTHGQSDRVRAPGSIGQGTSPGRVHKGKKMAGRLGSSTHTVKNSQVVFFDKGSGEIWVTGHTPGGIGGLLRLTVTGHKDAPKLINIEVKDSPKDPKHKNKTVSLDPPSKEDKQI